MQRSEGFQLEQSLLRVPAAGLTNVFRSYTTTVQKELSSVSSGVADLQGKTTLSTEDAKRSVGTWQKRMTNLKRKLEEMNAEEVKHVQHCQARLKHLKLAVEDSGDANNAWNKARVDRLLIDYLLREGHYDTAQQMALETTSTELVDREVYVRSHKVLEDLSKKSCREALAWCTEHKSRLRKIQSGLEFSLRLQEFIELVRVAHYPEAIAYARKYLGPLAKEPVEIQQLQVAMATLAFKATTNVSPYKELFAEDRWKALLDQFKQDNYVLHSLPQYPLLYTTLQAGLAALKTQLCYLEGQRHINCPVCDTQYSKLAEDLPFSQYTKSFIVCSITKQPYDEHDYAPLVLPNGNVYSKKALEDIANARKDGKIVCPKSGQVYALVDVKRAYIL